MRQRNITGYPLVVTPPDGGSHRDPFELAPGEQIDFPTPIPGCAADDGVTEPQPAKAAAKKPPAKTADGGDPA